MGLEILTSLPQASNLLFWSKQLYNQILMKILTFYYIVQLEGVKMLWTRVSQVDDKRTQKCSCKWIDNMFSRSLTPAMSSGTKIFLKIIVTVPPLGRIWKNKNIKLMDLLFINIGIKLCFKFLPELMHILDASHCFRFWIFKNLYK